MQSYISSIRFINKGEIFNDANIPEAADNEPYQIVGCSLDKYTVFGFANQKAIFYYDVTKNKFIPQKLELNDGIVGLYRAYGSILIAFNNGNVQQLIIKDNSLILDEKVLFRNVNNIISSGQSFEALYNGVKCLILFQFDDEDGTKILVQEQQTLRARKIENGNVFWRDDTNNIKVQTLANEDIMLAYTPYGVVTFNCESRKLKYKETEIEITQLGEEIFQVSTIPRIISNSTQFMHLIINDAEIKIFDLQYKNDKFQLLSNGQQVETQPDYKFTMINDDENFPDKFIIIGQTASNIQLPLMEDFKLITIDETKQVEPIKVISTANCSDVEQCVEENKGPIYQIIVKCFEKSTVQIFTCCTRRVQRDDIPYCEDRSSITNYVCEKVLLDDSNIKLSSQPTEVFDEAAEKLRLQKIKEEQEEKKREAIRQAELKAQKEREQQEELRRQKEMHEKVINELKSYWPKMLLPQDINSCIQTVPVRQDVALQLMNGHVGQAELANIQSIGQPRGIVFLDQSISDGTYKNALTQGKVGNFIVHPVLGSRFGAVVEDTIQILPQRYSEKALLDFGAFSSQEINCMPLPEYIIRNQYK